MSRSFVPDIRTGEQKAFWLILISGMLAATAAAAPVSLEYSIQDIPELVEDPGDLLPTAAVAFQPSFTATVLYDHTGISRRNLARELRHRQSAVSRLIATGERRFRRQRLLPIALLTFLHTSLPDPLSRS